MFLVGTHIAHFRADYTQKRRRNIGKIVKSVRNYGDTVYVKAYYYFQGKKYKIIENSQYAGENAVPFAHIFICYIFVIGYKFSYNKIYQL